VLNFKLVIHFVRIYQLYSLKKTLYGLKHAEVTYIVNEVAIQ